ncbi:hypothetical protein RB195_005942 [Necator americanus]|uniref:Uncharacterized protein n=1 Tax=Necator americanus TaxID=51031 RepID=A0ABR1BT70_NECAM
MYTSVATLQIAKDHNLTEYVIFGDSKKFMKKLAEQLYRNNSSKDGKDSVYYLNYTDANLRFRKRVKEELFLRNWKPFQV